MRGVVMSTNGRYAVILTKKGDFVKVKNKNYSVGDTVSLSSNVSRICAAAASLFLVLGGIGSYLIPTGYISIDINPSLLISVNIYDRVIDIKALNDDAAKLLAQTDVRVKNTEEAIDILIQKSEEIGYISDNNKEVIIEVVSDINSFNPRNYDRIEVSIEKADRNSLRNAQNMGVSIAKAKAIEEYTRQNGGEMQSNADMLKDKSVKEIRKEFNRRQDNMPVPQNIPSDSKAPIHDIAAVHAQNDSPKHKQKNNDTSAYVKRDKQTFIPQSAPDPMPPIYVAVTERPTHNEPVTDEPAAKPQKNNSPDNTPEPTPQVNNDKPKQEQPVQNKPVIDRPPENTKPDKDQQINIRHESSNHKEPFFDATSHEPQTGDNLKNDKFITQASPVQSKPVIDRYEHPISDKSDQPHSKPDNAVQNQAPPANNKPMQEPVNDVMCNEHDDVQLQEPDNQPQKPPADTHQSKQTSNEPANSDHQELPPMKNPVIDNISPPPSNKPRQEQPTDSERIDNKPIQELPPHNTADNFNKNAPADNIHQDNPKPGSKTEPPPPVTEHNTPQPSDTSPYNGGNGYNRESFDR